MIMPERHLPSVMIPVAPLSSASFAPFGDIVSEDGALATVINQNFAERYSDLADVDVQANGGKINVSLMTAYPRSAPIVIALMERHPLGSQLFFPLQDQPWLIVVCTDPYDISSFRAFHATGHQGVNYTRNTWHFPLLVHDSPGRFLTIDRQGPGINLEEAWLERCVRLPPSW